MLLIDIPSTSVAMRRPADGQTRIHQIKRQLSDMRKMQPIYYVLFLQKFFALKGTELPYNLAFSKCLIHTGS